MVLSFITVVYIIGFFDIVCGFLFLCSLHLISPKHYWDVSLRCPALIMLVLSSEKFFFDRESVF